MPLDKSQIRKGTFMTADAVVPRRLPADLREFESAANEANRMACEDARATLSAHELERKRLALRLIKVREQIEALKAKRK